METLNNIVLTIQHYLADYILIVALLGGGIWFSVKLGFIQIRGFGEGMRRTFGGNRNRRAGSYLLDVDRSVFRNGDHLRRGGYGSEV